LSKNNTEPATVSINSLKIFSLNVCGIKSKLVSPDFSNLIENYDILVFIEYKTDKLDILDIPTDYD
jgi:hypothetical protein